MVHLDQPLHIHSSHCSPSLTGQQAWWLRPKSRRGSRLRSDDSMSRVRLEEESVRFRQSQYFHEGSGFLLGQRHFEHLCVWGFCRAFKTVLCDICRGIERATPPTHSLVFKRNSWLVLPQHCSLFQGYLYTVLFQKEQEQPKMKRVWKRGKKGGGAKM